MQIGFKINISKPKRKSDSKVPPRRVDLQGKEIDLVYDFVYLGQKISLMDTNQMSEINRRIRLGWAAFGKLNIFKSELLVCLKTKDFNQCIIPTMTCIENMVLNQENDKQTEDNSKNYEKIYAEYNKKYMKESDH